MLSNNKFLGKCWYGRHPWIRLAMDCERMVEKGINFILCLGTSYYVSSMQSIGNYSVVFVDGKSVPPKIILSLNLSFELWHHYKSLLPSTKGLSIYFYAIFIFIWVSIFSYKAPNNGHNDRTWALDVANMRVCFMNGSMIEHNGLGIAFFSVDILKDMFAYWYAWVLRSSCKIIDYCFESSKVQMSFLQKKRICDKYDG